ncbi:ubiquitin-conjugating enzyme E2 6 [Coccidioides immitis H538.4]|uniref:Ubiquitin-conjugating enzyme E2 6 n=2 Tax=Coccidioides immitis TaxID=5501 RepID=A0A0J8RLB8_COCIT|nr:ubiquitin-conjugating enzyme E2 6 [Coccidioides immitis RMSCC 2394]KMU85925.1 ubiquitin-conjugating enzyme E2 6 [Coccidioides immitis H538.4]
MAVPGPTLRRLMKEAQELSESSSSPSPYFHAHPISDSNLLDWHFTLAGPPSPSPYANGIYHGRIILSPQYPLRPPSFRFLTPSGRFEVNREICLSISGHHDETWQPAWGIRTALTAIRSFMDGDAKGQIGGIEAREETNEEVLKAWWEVCKKKGVAVEEQEDKAVGSNGAERLPDGLRVVYRDELGKSESPMSLRERAQEHMTLADSSGDAGTVQVEIASRASIIPETHSTPAPPASSATTSVRERRSRPRTQASTTSTTNITATTQSTDGPWLDRAIVAVIIALALMVLKKIFYSASNEERF